MEQNKITKWVVGEPTKSGTGIFIKDADGRPILRIYSYPGGSHYDLERITRAINGTYGVGIRPESVVDLKKCLEELLAQFEKVVEPKYTLDHMLIREAKVAIEKAKL